MGDLNGSSCSHRRSRGSRGGGRGGGGAGVVISSFFLSLSFSVAVFNVNFEIGDVRISIKYVD